MRKMLYLRCRKPLKACLMNVLKRNFLLLLLSCFTGSLLAQSVIFPQEQQAGTARLETGDGQTYSLVNDLFSAAYRVQDGHLLFGGSEALGLNGGTELFRLRLANGIEVASSEMTMGDVRTVELPADAAAAKGALHFPGKALEADFTYGDLDLTWRAVLRDGSHYLRTELSLTARKDVAMKAITPMLYSVDNASSTKAPAVVGNTRGAVIASDHIFAGLETPMGINTAGEGMTGEPFAYAAWTGSTFNWTPGDETPQGILALGFTTDYISGVKGYLGIAEAGNHTVRFQYASGSHRLDIAGVDVLDPFTGEVVASDYHKGTTGGSSSKNTYTLNIPASGYYLVRYFRDLTEERNGIISGSFNSNGTITWSGTVTAPQVVYDGRENDLSENVLHLAAPTETQIRGEWSRQTTLKAGETWTVSAVVGLIAPGQVRRSFLCYSERERAVPWRPFTLYNSWFELNINRNNDPDYTGNFTEAQCLDVLAQWKQKLYDAHGLSISSFAWDDGWDEYGTWTFNKNFPNGFQLMSDKAVEMDSHIGAWLGPVGGYGQSGTYRRNYWSNRGGMQLSNKAYFDTFLTACTRMLTDYSFNFFKFDGISAQFSATGPDGGATGEENAEGIIEIERRVRQVKPDVFLNTTVGTWASPFWFQFTDAVWRQENDYGTIGNQGSDREQWITYRDRLVYQNFVERSPLCPINTLMTHGFILSKFGNVSSDVAYSAVRRELRCAFACGSGMVEVYADYSLMNSINNGRLWSDLADCIRWQRDNADVLPDIHWVGGNPWDGSQANVYGWASWNARKATLALRNPSASSKTFTTTLREALDIPDYVHTTITLSNAFTQTALSGLPIGEPIDIDTPLSLRLSASSVYVYNGVDNSADLDDGIRDIREQGGSQFNAQGVNVQPEQLYDLSGRRISPNSTRPGVTISRGKKLLVKP